MNSKDMSDIEYITEVIDRVIMTCTKNKNDSIRLLTDISRYCHKSIKEMIHDKGYPNDKGDENNSVVSDDSGKSSIASEYDYPFTSWSAHSGALLESLQTEFYGETYPKYKKACDNETDDYCIIVDLVELHGEDPQEILDDLVEMMCNDGKRYAEEMLDEGRSDIIDYLLLKGAKMNIDTMVNYKSCDFEDDIDGNHIRASLIDYYFPKLGITADEYKDIKAIGYEEINAMEEEIDMNNPYALLDIVKSDLKFKSKFLSGL